jgi:hypothetical protein
MLKAISIAATFAVISSTSFAAEAIRSNVPCDGGSVPGFMVQSGTIDFYAIHGTDVSACPAGTVELPADVHPFDLDEVQAYLADIEPGVEYRLEGSERVFAQVFDAAGNIIGLEQVGTVDKAVNGGW